MSARIVLTFLLVTAAMLIGCNDGPRSSSAAPPGPGPAGQAHFTCDACGRGIPPGQPMWTVNVHKETYDGAAITVLDAAVVKSYCSRCGPERDFTRLTVPKRR